MKATKIWRSVLCLVLCFALVLQFVTIPAAAAESDELFVNGTFETDANGDGKADGWSYYIGSAVECPSTLGEDGITINADSTSAAQRLTVHQTVAVTSGSTYRLTLRYQVVSTGIWG